MSGPQPTTVEQEFRHSWWGKFVALIALVNLALVLFNLTYLPLRNTYIHWVPTLVNLYDPVAAIEREPHTTQYLDTVEQLAGQLNRESRDAPQVQSLLTQLRQQSETLVDGSLFLSSGKLGSYGTMAKRIEAYQQTHSLDRAFDQFWSSSTFSPDNWRDAMDFFNRQIRPELETNYLRLVDRDNWQGTRFWQLDAPFVAFFAVVFAVQTHMVSRSQPSLTWWGAMVRRWYDALMLIPIWRWLRILPVGIHLHRSGLLNIERPLAHLAHDPTAYLSDRVAEFLMVRLVNQAKDSVSEGEALALLVRSSEYVRSGNTDKLGAIADRLLELTIYNVIPHVEPELRELLEHSMEETLRQFDIYRGVEQLPGLRQLPGAISEQLAAFLTQSSSQAIAEAYADDKGRELLSSLIDRFRQSLRAELQSATTQAELQTMLIELLEDWKQKYVKKATYYDPELTMAELDEIRIQTDPNLSNQQGDNPIPAE
ncbi:hypothetical protein [Synechococcus sp. PCC 7336]|uniref:hypothetical protein n=1 Tax=Synechococcus sp. PCC 7336 TaxID=195250 RepID=UPI00037271F3|nr:hypothetical protein [Synechococcus sp. PCC 7336]